ncbi:MAG: gliding motility-associated C-terminal domain-containing protein, partial [Saprospiraceae bacterium]
PGTVQAAAEIGLPIINCGPGAIALIGMPAPGFPLTVLWESLGDGSFSNASSQAVIYTPGALDSISSSIAIVYNIIDPICGNQSDTMNIIFNAQPFALFSNDTFAICDQSDKGSILNFPSLIIGGDMNGVWTNSGGAPVNFSNPSSVDFNGVATGFYTFMYQTNSAIPPCQNASYSIIVSVQVCLCPIITVQPLPGGICNSLQTLALNAFVIAGAPGTWVILSAPPGSNPATVIGSNMQIQGADPGLYSLRFTFDSAPIIACPDSAEIEVLIQDVPSISVSSDTSICGISDVPLTAIVGGSATNAVWFTSGSGIFDNTISLNPVYMPSNADLVSGQIRLIAKTIDSLGFCTDALDTTYLNLFAPPFVIWSALKDTVCNVIDSGSVVNLNSFITAGDLTGIWTDVDGTGVDLSAPSLVDFAGFTPGNYHFNYTTQSAMPPCKDVSYVFEVLVEDCACPLLEISDINGPVCIPTSVNLNALISNASSGFWSLYDGPVSASWPVILGNSVITDNADPGQYILRYQLIDSVPGCMASKFISFTLDQSPLVTSTSFICDADLLHYSVQVNTNAFTVISDFGTVSLSSPGLFSVQGIPAGQNIVLQLSSASGNCTFTMPISAPDCTCTLMIENLSDTIFLCRGDTFTLIPIVTGATGIPFNTWIGPGFSVQRPSFKIFEDGTFIWSVRDALCERRDTFHVKVYDSVLLSDTLLPPFCPGGSDGSVIISNISQGVGPYSVQLDNRPPFSLDIFPDTIKMISSGNHTLGITDLNGCESLFTISVPDPMDRLLNLGPDQSIKKGDSVLISPLFTNIAVADFIWDPATFNLGLLPQWIKPEETVSLSLSVTDSSGCVFQDEVLIKVTVDQFFYIPTVFSPNGDQINDVLTIETSSSPIDLMSLEIFDRWGSMVYKQTNSAPFSWNGTFKNQPVQSGVYILKLHYKDAEGKDQYYFNDITVLH